MDSNFDKCLAFVLKEEGGNDDDPNDHGGRTSRGITQREWDKFRITHPDRPEDVWKASDEDIKTIYHDEYWLPHCPTLPAGVDLVFFDFAVNAGPHQAIKKLQQTVGIPVDGSWGPATEVAVRTMTNIPTLINLYSDARENFYKGLAQYSRYGKGWSGRTERARREAQMLIRPDVTMPSPKANPKDIKINTTHGPAAGAVVVAAGTAAAAHYHSPLIFLIIIGAAVAIGLIVHYLANRKAITNVVQNIPPVAGG